MKDSYVRAWEELSDTARRFAISEYGGPEAWLDAFERVQARHEQIMALHPDWVMQAVNEELWHCDYVRHGAHALWDPIAGWWQLLFREQGVAFVGPARDPFEAQEIAHAVGCTPEGYSEAHAVELNELYLSELRIDERNVFMPLDQATEIDKRIGGIGYSKPDRQSRNARYAAYHRWMSDKYRRMEPTS